MTSTLSDFGVINLDLLIPPAYLPPNEIIKETHDWQELHEFLEQNKKTHPTDRLWIINDPKRGMFQVRRER